MRPITATQICLHLSLPELLLPYLVFQIIPKSYLLCLSIFVLVRLVVFFQGVSILIPLSLGYFTSIRGQPMQFFYFVILLLCSVLYVVVVILCCFYFHIIEWYFFVLVHIFFLIFVFQRLLFCFHLLWSLAVFHKHIIKELVW